MTFVSDNLLKVLLEFRRERDWEQFHTPRNLAASISIEAAELLECFQWAKDGELAALVETERNSIQDEIADIAILLTYLCHDLGVDVEQAVQTKLAENARKYPVELARGNARKYDRF